MGVADFLAAMGKDSCVDTSTLARGLYSSDASLYRVVPQVVAVPRDVDELLEVVDTALTTHVPITARGAGTSCAGNAVGPGVVIDMRRHLNHIREIDTDAHTAVVEPGVVQESLQRILKPHGLRYGPDPSTSSRCTIGGIVANNACGPRALGYGVASSNLADVDVIVGTGARIRLSQLCGATRPEADESRQESLFADEVSRLIDSHLGVIRTEFGRFSRQVSGYSLQHLLPENHRDMVRFFAGTEGTVGIATQLTVRLVKDPPATLTLALGYPSMDEAADAVMALLDFRPTALEGMDSRIVDVVRRRMGANAVPPLPRGRGWTFVELAGDDDSELASRGEALIKASGCLEGWVVADKDQASRLWSLRSDGAGLAGVSLDKPAYPGWEDAAVPPQHLGEYLRAFEAALDDFGFHSLPYGHFGEGCVHARIDFPLSEPGGTGRYKQFVTQCAHLVADFGGSLSGEHGDGRARSDLLPIMYSQEAISVFEQIKGIFDPQGLLNPGVIVHPHPVDDDVRYAGLVGNPMVLSNPQFSEHVHRCTGMGKCVAAHPPTLMCPSYEATHEEKDSTRGRARILQEMVNGTLISGWDSPEVEEALDLCLACKGCSSDCPTGVDIASAKSVVLDNRYRGKLRPRSHYALGWLPRWGRVISAAHVGPLANAVLGVPGLSTVAKRVAGVDPRRPLPRFSFGSARRSHHQVVGERGSTPIVVWVDSFADSFSGTALPALMQALRLAGYAPRVLEGTACCGLTWITTGQRDAAARQIRHSLDVLAPIIDAGTTIVGMEPSCLAVWRSDAIDLVDDPRVRFVGEGIRTLAEVLVDTPGWQAPDLSGHEIVVQPHCHHTSVVGWKADEDVLKRTGASLTTLTGCCGLAGNFGVELGHYETSVAVAESHLLPVLRAHPHAIVLADGFSCRKQIADLTNRQAMTLAELIVSHS